MDAALHAFGWLTDYVIINEIKQKSQFVLHIMLIVKLQTGVTT